MKKAATDILKENVIRLFDSEGFRAALSFYRGFRKYSFTNSFLIHIQKPDATRVAGFNTWKDKGRTVRKGEKGIAIRAPMIRKDDNGDKKMFGFRNVYVFDISQTEGDEIPEFPDAIETISNGDFSGSSERLVALAKEHGVVVEYKELQVGGYYSSSAKVIALKKGATPVVDFTTLVHEVAHMLLHTEEKGKRHVMELEAESVSYLVADGLGLDTGAFSFPYIAGWLSEGTQSELLSAIDRAAKVANRLLEVLGGENPPS